MFENSSDNDLEFVKVFKWKTLLNTNFSVLLNQLKIQDSDDFQNIAELISINEVKLNSDDDNNPMLKKIFEKQDDLTLGFEKGEFSLQSCMDVN